MIWIALLAGGLLFAQERADPRLGDGPLEQAFSLEPCDPEGRQGDLLCGSLQVPENYEDPAGRSISLNIAVAPALNSDSEVPPLFILAGGPGLGATGMSGYYLGPGQAYRERRDVVLVDQRGTGDSSPLQCPSLESLSPLEEMYPLPEVESCRRELESKADLTQYTTLNSARDLDRVRSALGYAAIDLSGISYGTELARAYMRLFPDRARRAILIGPPPNDMRTPLPHAANAQRALDLLFHECQTDPECNAAFPNLREDWRSVLDKLAKGFRTGILDPVTGKTNRIEVRKGPFAEAFRGLLATASGRRDVPRMIRSAAQGDFEPLLNAFPRDGSGFAEGLYLSIACSEGTSRIEPKQIRRYTAETFLGDYRVNRQMAACGVWPRSAPPPEFYEPAATDHPVLTFAGEFDATTPPTYAREICRSLENCLLVEIPGMGHVPFDLPDWRGGDCLVRLSLDFLEAEAGRHLDRSCVGRMAPPPFSTESTFPLAPEQLHEFLGTYESGVLRFNIDFLNDRLRVKVFRNEDLLGASMLSPLSESRFRFDHFPGLHATFESDRFGMKAILSDGETLRRIEEPD